jgi:hypothetical protein
VRLAALISYTRSQSRYFADLYREVPEPCKDAGQLPVVTIEKAAEPPQLHPKSGKFQQVWSELKQSLPANLA